MGFATATKVEGVLPLCWSSIVIIVIVLVGSVIVSLAVVLQVWVLIGLLISKLICRLGVVVRLRVGSRLSSAIVVFLSLTCGWLVVINGALLLAWRHHVCVCVGQDSESVQILVVTLLLRKLPS